MSIQFIPEERIVAGVDEAGRGCLAGPVVAAAVILKEFDPIDGLRDSKKLSPAKRISFEKMIKARSLAWTLGLSWPREIDNVNILEASLRAMSRAVCRLKVRPDLVLVDGNKIPPLDLPCRAIVGGDDKVPVISAASVLAKTFRDRLMEHLDKRYPGYGLKKHKGYATKVHLKALQALGPCSLHRQSFAPVKKLRFCCQQCVLPGI